MEDAICSAGTDLLGKVITKVFKEAQSALDINSNIQSLEMTKCTIEALRSDVASHAVKLPDAHREVLRQLFGSLEDMLNFLDVREAQALYHHGWVKDHFDQRIWVWVSPSFKLEEVVRKIAKFVTNQELPHCDMSQLQRYLIRHISQRKILLVLDNIWDDDHFSYNWRRLRDLFRSVGVGGAVLITTRSDTVARIERSIIPHMLGGLEAEDSWRLFQRHLSIPSLEPRLEKIGRDIARMCGNVPLAICNIGSLLSEMPPSISEWSKFRDELARLGCCGRDQSIQQILKFSYDRLYPSELKLCVDLLATFPKWWWYKKVELMYLWRALGYVKPRENQSWVHAAVEYLLRLKSRGFIIEDDGSHVRVHDLIHDLAVSIASSSCKMVDSDAYNLNEEIRHLSISYGAKFSGENFLISSSISKIKNLQSLVVFGTKFALPQRKLDLKGVSRLEHLRVLSAPGTLQRQVPSTIGRLMQLRYLDLSDNNFRELPNSVTLLVNLLYLKLSCCKGLQKLPVGLGKLVNLEYLDLYCCSSLEELPKDLSKLRKLRHLLLWGCNKLKHMPPGLGNLPDLVELDSFIVRGQSSSPTKPNVGQLADLSGLNNLTGDLKIVVDGSWSSEAEARAANLQAKENMTGLEIRFEGGWSRDNEVVLEGLQPPCNLEYLGITGHRGERLPRWIDGKCHLGNLRSLLIEGWKECRHLGCLGRLPCLRQLTVIDCENLEYIEREKRMDGDGDHGDANADANIKAPSASPLFPRLETLSLYDLPKLKGWQRGSCRAGPSDNQECLWLGATPGAFPKLKKIYLILVGMEVVPEEFRGLPSLEWLYLFDCQQLTELPEWIDTLTLLKELIIRECPKVERMPMQIAKLPNLQYLSISRSPNLEERCKETTGEDWPLIRHLPRIKIPRPQIPSMSSSP